MNRHIFLVFIALMLSGGIASAAISLSKALNKLADKHNIIIAHSPTLTDNVTVNYTIGDKSIGKELDKMLSETDFSYGKVDDDVYYLKKDKKKIKARKKRELKERKRIAQVIAKEGQLKFQIDHREWPQLGAMLLPQASLDTVPCITGTSYYNDSIVIEPEKPRFALKTNALLLATASANVAFEMTIGPYLSVELPISINQWSLGDMHLHHYAIIPTVKYWLGNEPFSSDYVGLYAGWANYDIANIDILGDNFTNYSYDGNLYSAGLLYGHRFNLSHHFALETEIGMGYVYLKYTQSHTSGVLPDSRKSKQKWSLTRLAFNICYTF